MFLEPQLNSTTQHVGHGWIEIICGSMFSGKTEELIRRVRRAVIAQQKVIIFKPALDTRYDHFNVVSHNRTQVSSIPVHYATDIYRHMTDDYQVVAIDEAQFFDAELLEVCDSLANRGCRVIVSGLDMDFEGKPFGTIPSLMSIAEFVTKLHAICAQCGDVASYSYRLVDSTKQVLLGEKDEYEARCRKCFSDGMRKHKQEGIF